MNSDQCKQYIEGRAEQLVSLAESGDVLATRLIASFIHWSSRRGDAKMLESATKHYKRVTERSKAA